MYELGHIAYTFATQQRNYKVHGIVLLMPHPTRGIVFAWRSWPGFWSRGRLLALFDPNGVVDVRVEVFRRCVLARPVELREECVHEFLLSLGDPAPILRREEHAFDRHAERGGHGGEFPGGRVEPPRHAADRFFLNARRPGQIRLSHILSGKP